MRCLCCGKEFSEKASKTELMTGWHFLCIRKFFGTKELPLLDVSSDALIQLANNSIRKGQTVPGVQKKMSLHLHDDSKDNPRLTLTDYPAGYILKPQTEEYEMLPQSEYLVMQMAQRSGIRTVPFALIRTEKDNEIAYITRRVDRILPNKKNRDLQVLAMEDFCQLDYRMTADKYKGSYERCSAIVSKYSCQKGLDLSELFLRIVFSFVSGNSDMHLKNFSLIETHPASMKYCLSPAYDLLPVNLVLPEDNEQTALTVNGKKRNLHRNDFLKFAKTSGLSAAAAEKMIEKIISYKTMYLAMCDESFLSDELREDFSSLITERIDALKKPGTSSDVYK